ncbi:polymeric immunoglobulin receptor isoform X2 [Arvicola amphibius]|uniref:polymeric immunoglobulin receptor isoform X2 n=1 Tax=Arvicola amphibius TaxID=1047088 RepID=UPI0018E3C254|nr:polymeric immunoglobulin receptor isoform X2 [Arvicola amphibius]
MAQPPWKPPAMKLFVFTILLAVLPAVITRSPVFGPQDVSSVVGNSVSITCYYPDTSVNRHTRKYWCRKGANGLCTTLISSNGYVSSEYAGRAQLINFPENNTFVINIAQLTQDDTGSYKCGLGTSNQPLFFDVSLEVSQESTMPTTRTVVKGVTGGSVAIACPYNPKDSGNLKIWCRWEADGNGHCPVLVDSQGKVNEQYEGRLALFDQPGDGTYTVILNQLTTQDAGFYWCLTNGDSRWRTTVELQVAEATGKPNLEVTPQNVEAVLGQTLTLDCHYPCKLYSHDKYWCKWNNGGCHTLSSQVRQPSVSCDPNNQLVALTLNPVEKEDEGWYWCGVKQGQTYGETTAIYVAVEGKSAGSRQVSAPDANAQANAAPEEEGAEFSASQIENKAVPNPRLLAEETGRESVGDQAQDSRASVDAGSTDGQSGSSKVLFSTLVPLGLVLAVGAVAVWVARVRHRKNVDRMSLNSYRTDISMGDFKNSRDLGGNDNMGVSPDIHETVLEGKDEVVTTTEIATEPEESKKAKRSSKEEADLAYSAFLLQSSNIAAQVHDGPRDV